MPRHRHVIATSLTEQLVFSAYVLLFPLNIWLLEIVLGRLIAAVHGHNVAWCYHDYSDAFGWGCARVGHAPVWLVLGAICWVGYPALVAMTSLLVA